MAGQKFDGEDLTKADLSWFDFTDASFRGCNLTYVNFQGANLTGADLRDTICYKTRFRDGNLIGAFLEMVDLSTADLTRSRF